MAKIIDNALIADRTIQLAHAAVRDGMNVTETFGRYSDETFTGRGDEPIFVRVQKPTLQAREYKLYNNREQPIEMDFIEETLVQLDIDRGRIYSATGLRDETRDFDLMGKFGEHIIQQANALSTKFEHTARTQLYNAPFEYVKYVDASETAIKKAISLGQDFLFNTIVEARTALAKMASPLANVQVYAVAGAEWASLFRRNQRQHLATGDNRPTAFADASIGTYAGVQIIEDLNLPAKELYLYTNEAFLCWSAGPSIPEGVTYGSKLNKDNLSMTWIRDYASAYVLGRSILWAYTAFGRTLDFVAAYDTNGALVPSEEQYFIRGAKLILGSGTDIEPGSGQGSTPGASPDSILAKLYTSTPVTAKESTTVFADLTYQNVKDGNVANGKAAELTVTDKIKRTRKNPDTPAEIPEDDS